MTTARERFFYRIVGPSSVHLQHEFYLLMSLVLLEISSLQALYHRQHHHGDNAFGSFLGDYQFTALVALWLSRFLMVRWVVTWDPSNCGRPTLSGVITHWMTSHVLAGQYFDRPSPHVVAKQIGVQHYHGNFETSRPAGPVAAARDFMWPSLIFTWRYVKSWLWYPMGVVVWPGGGVSRQYRTSISDATSGHTQYQSHGRSSGHNKKQNRKSSGSVSANPLSSVSPASTSSYYTSQASKLWKDYGPSLQMIIPAVTFMLIFWYGMAVDDIGEPPYALTMNMHTANGNNALGALEHGLGGNIKPHGAYRKLTTPSWGQVLYCLSCFGTVLSIIMYGRIFLPIPDLVAGSNVLQAMRNESRQQYQMQQQRSQRSSRASRMQRENPDLPWLEYYKSIVNENRFRLFCKVTFVRVLENILVCFILPQTSFVCRATGHCPNHASAMDLARIFYFAGITTPLRKDQGMFQSESASMSPDAGSSIMTLVSIVVITVALLLTQATTLNRSYLGIMGYLTGEWVVVDTDADPSILEGPGQPSAWDPRRKYKKGDLIAESTSPNFGSVVVYRATSNNPEGRPFDLYLRASHDLFRNELGHPASSQVIAFLSTVQFGLISILILVMLGYQIMDYDNSSLLWTLAANLVACYGTIGVAMPRYSEMDTYATELTN
jgi:hypothetical protein